MKPQKQHKPSGVKLYTSRELLESSQEEIGTARTTAIEDHHLRTTGTLAT